jgi:hypothetical protein
MDAKFMNIVNELKFSIDNSKRKKPKKIVTVIRLIIICSIFINFFTFVPENSEASLVVVTLEAVPASKGANVRPGEIIPVFFNGNVSARKFPVTKVQQVEIYLDYEDPGDQWTVILLPPLIVLSQGVLRDSFRVGVLPSPQAKANTQKQINITGTYRITPSSGSVITYGVLEPITLSVVVQQFYRLNVYEEPVIHYVWPGDTVEYELVIQNMGNGEDTFDIDPTNEDSLIEGGYAVEIYPSSITIGPRNESRVRVIVHGAKPIFHPWRIGNTEIGLLVTSQGARINHVHYEAATIREASLYYYENGPIVSEPCWISIIILIAIVVSFLMYRRNKYKKWEEKRIKKRKEKGIAKRKGKEKVKDVDFEEIEEKHILER